jgi:hypothetical protein
MREPLTRKTRTRNERVATTNFIWFPPGGEGSPKSYAGNH